MSRDLLVGLPLLAALVHCYLGVYASRFRRVPAARSFGIAMFLIGAWALVYSGELLAPDLAGKMLWLRLRVPLYFLGPTWFLMSLQLVGRGRRLGRPAIACLYLVPAATALIQLNTSRIGLIRLDPHLIYGEAFPLLAWRPGPVLAGMMLYTNLIVLAALGVLVGSLRDAHPTMRFQIWLVIAGTAGASGAELLNPLGLAPIPGYSLTPAVMIVTATLVGLALFRYGMFSIVPIARGLVVENMPDVVLVLDMEHRVVDANQAAQNLVGHDAAWIIGRPTTEVLHEWVELVREYYDQDAVNTDITAQVRGETLSLHLTISPLRDRRGRLLGRLLILHDITELQRAKKAAEEALASVRTLRGLLPICASCKRIRDDGGYWQAVEAYVQAHTDAEFTHGICPECISRLYPEMAADIAAARKKERADAGD